MTKLEAWKAWCAYTGTGDRLANEFTLENSSHGKAFSFAWDAASANGELRYKKLADAHSLALSQNHMASNMSATGAVADFQERLADAIEDMPFGDTATSFAVFVREFK